MRPNEHGQDWQRTGTCNLVFNVSRGKSETSTAVPKKKYEIFRWCYGDHNRKQSEVIQWHVSGLTSSSSAQ